MSLSTLGAVAKRRKRPWVSIEVARNQVTCEWTIPASEVLPMGNCDAIVSPMFHTGNGKQQWWLELYPRGENKTCADAVSFYLYLEESERLPIHVEFTISIWKSNVMIEAVTYTNIYDALDGFGEPHFVEQSKVFGPKCPEITIKVHFKTDFGASTMQLTKDLRYLLEDPKFSDFTIIVGDDKFPVHKNILSARSSIFAAMFHHEGMDENRKNEVKIQDLEPAVVKGMLEYIYTGEVLDLKVLASGLLGAAERYDLELLKGECEKTLYNNVDVSNAVEILMLANLYRANRLKNSAMQFIKDNLYEVTQTDGYNKMTDHALLKEIMAFGLKPK